MTMAREFSYGTVEVFNEETLGVGSYGKVCKAKCGKLPCAAKVLHDTMFHANDPGIYRFVERFEQECQFLKRITHPNIVACLGTSRDPRSQRLVLLMELMDESLTKFIERSTSSLLYHTQLNICHDIALALEYLHANNIVHRDLSSNNVLLIGNGVRAKVTDFGMSTLINLNPRMTPLTMCPGTVVYMPPEALVMGPQYSSKLDCFSHGVLTIQIITRQFPNPGAAHRHEENPAYPTGKVVIQLPETERRKKDLDLIEPNHPLLPLALHSLRDRDMERPSASELCERIAFLKQDPKYTCSVEQSCELSTSLQTLQQQFEEKDRKLEECYSQLQKKRWEYEKELSAKELKMEQVQEELKAKESLIEQLQERLKSNPVQVEAVSTDMELTWRQGTPAPETMESCWKGSVGHNDTAYFSMGYNVYSYTVPGAKWTTLKRSKYQDFGMAVVNNKLTTVGGYQGDSATNALLSLSSKMKWEKVLPPMRTKRVGPAVISTPTHLVVAGGRTTHLGGELSTVEVLNISTLHWHAVASLPTALVCPNITLNAGNLYLSGRNMLYSCSLTDLLKSANDTSSSTWTRLADIPVPYGTSLATLKGHVVAIGGSDGYSVLTGLLHRYDTSTNSWSIIGEMPTPRCDTQVAVLNSTELVVIGGYERKQGSRYTSRCKVNEVVHTA